MRAVRQVHHNPLARQVVQVLRVVLKVYLLLALSAVRVANRVHHNPFHLLALSVLSVLRAVHRQVLVVFQALAVSRVHRQVLVPSVLLAR